MMCIFYRCFIAQKLTLGFLLGSCNLLSIKNIFLRIWPNQHKHWAPLKAHDYPSCSRELTEMLMSQKWSQCEVSLLKPSPGSNQVCHMPMVLITLRQPWCIKGQGWWIQCPLLLPLSPSSERAVTISLAKCLQPNEERKRLEIQIWSLQVL